MVSSVKNKMTSRWLAALLAMVVLLISTNISVFAAVPTEKTADITVTGVEAEEEATISIYRLMDVHFDTTTQSPETPEYTWVDEVANWVTQYDEGHGTDFIGEGNAVTETFSTADQADIDTFYAVLAAEIRAGSLTLTAAGSQSTTDGQITFEDMQMGNYLVLVTGGVNIYRPASVNLVATYEGDQWNLNNATITLKYTEPQIDKDVIDDEGNPVDTGTANVGDTITYQIEANVPQYPENAVSTKFEIGDKLSAGLTFNDDITVYGVNAEGVATELTEDADYQQLDQSQFEGVGERDFIVAPIYDQVKGYEKIRVTYTATINENAIVEGADNDAYLDYNNDPYDGDSYKENDDHTPVYLYGIDITKVDGDNTETALAGAEFQLLKDGQAIEMTYVADGNYYRPATTEETGTTTLITGEGGKLLIKGLEEGEYTLRETKAPGDYNLPQDPDTEIVLNDSDDDGFLNIGEQDNSDTIALSVANFKGFELPVTGGMGTIMFTAGGVVLMAAAIALVVVASKKRRSQAN